MTCANCTAPAAYDYVGIRYCEKHLPRFLKTGRSEVAATKLDAPSVPQPVNLPAPAAPIAAVSAPKPKPKVKNKAS